MAPLTETLESVTATTDPVSARTAANRLNALKSTGPRSLDGKSRSRRNALKHGLSGAGVVVPPDVEALTAVRLKAWTNELAPQGPIECDLVKVGATSMTLVEFCWKESAAARRRASLRGEISWDGDRHEEVALLMLKLPKQPQQVVYALGRSSQGVSQMRELWRELALRLAEQGEWTDPQVQMALDLLGTPLLFRDALHPLDVSTLSPEEGREARLLIAESEIERLTEELDCLEALDDHDRDDRLRGLNTFLDPDVARLRRYETTLTRRVLSTLAVLRRGQTSSGDVKKRVSGGDESAKASKLAQMAQSAESQTKPSGLTVARGPKPIVEPVPSCETKPTPPEPSPPAKVHPKPAIVVPAPVVNLNIFETSGLNLMNKGLGDSPSRKARGRAVPWIYHANDPRHNSGSLDIAAGRAE